MRRPVLSRRSGAVLHHRLRHEVVDRKYPGDADVECPALQISRQFVTELPMTGVGKVDKKVLKAGFWVGRDRDRWGNRPLVVPDMRRHPEPTMASRFRLSRFSITRLCTARPK